MSRTPRFQGANNRVPDDWLNCPAIAAKVIGETFIVFKTPLDSRYDAVIEDNLRLHPDAVFEAATAMNVQLGLWIDLTITHRYYDKEIVKSKCDYKKIGLGPHPPTEAEVCTFLESCRDFKADHPSSMIGVHCTHGHNRTGFLVVSYLVRELNLTLEDAVAEFARVRPPGIYKKSFMDELFRRYGNGRSHGRILENPEWRAGNSAPTRHQSMSPVNIEPPVFMKGVPGIEPLTDQEVAAEIWGRMRQIFPLSKEGYFPGSQPVSMDQCNMHELEERHYRVSWKADGTRYMMYIDDHSCIYFIDRQNRIFDTKRRWAPAGAPRLRNTLLDGEMTTAQNGVHWPFYLVYDVMWAEDKILTASPFSERYTFLETIVDRYNNDLFSVRPKPYNDISEAYRLQSIRFQHENKFSHDGLIFQPWNDEYRSGRHYNLLKWKPKEQNSIDFKLDIDREKKKGMLKVVDYSGRLEVFDYIQVTEKIERLDGKIIECRRDDNREWRLMKVRDDRTFPNSLKTAKRVLDSIENPVTRGDLFQIIDGLIGRERLNPPEDHQFQPRDDLAHQRRGLKRSREGQRTEPNKRGR